MPDPESSPPFSAETLANLYPTRTGLATPSLEARLKKRIAEEGPLKFPEFMAAALYDPQLGYYARETRQVGRAGDFFTSVSVGPLFGEILARRFLRWWRETGSPNRWRITEIGAHDGTLANDVLSTLEKIEPVAFSAVEYAIVEPLPLLQNAQREKLNRFQNVRFISDPAELSSTPLPGIIFGNEILDALPFHIIEWKTGRWHECEVALDAAGEFSWDVSKPVDDPKFLEALNFLGTGFPENYRTEFRTNFAEFLSPLLNGLSTGLLIWPDYGFARPEYYHPDRKTGTLRTFSKHKADEDPLKNPGEIDITAHVDFTAVAEAAIELGAKPVVFRTQGNWITHEARDWLISLEGRPDASALRQFQSLTHPAQLGSRFHFLELAWNDPAAALSDADFHRLALRACPRATGG